MIDHDVHVKRYGNKVGCQVTRLKSQKTKSSYRDTLLGDRIIQCHTQ